MNQDVTLGELREQLVSRHPFLEHHGGFESESHHGLLDVAPVRAIADNPVLARRYMLVQRSERSQAEVKSLPVHKPANTDGPKWADGAHGDAAETSKVFGCQCNL